jgi:hypothetical protein
MAKAKTNLKNLSVDEIIAFLNHSTLPTILVEGDDDRVVYRWLEQLIPWQEGVFEPCGGREKLLKVYSRRSELKVNTVFLADQDMWERGRSPNLQIWERGGSPNLQIWKRGGWLTSLVQTRPNLKIWTPVPCY